MLSVWVDRILCLLDIICSVIDSHDIVPIHEVILEENQAEINIEICSSQNISRLFVLQHYGLYAWS
jgi:hypothetical protein